MCIFLEEEEKGDVELGRARIDILLFFFLWKNQIA